MNNYWHTNFKADQEGETVFHYSIFPHDVFDVSEATKRGIESNQPLLVSSAGSGSAELQSLFFIQNKNIILSTIKPTIGKKGMILRMYNASSQSQKPEIKWTRLKPKEIYWSNANQEKLQSFNPSENWPPLVFRTLYLQL
jgi:alpha-mannosidase